MKTSLAENLNNVWKTEPSKILPEGIPEKPPPKKFAVTADMPRQHEFRPKEKAKRK